MLTLHGLEHLTDEEFFHFCVQNPDRRIERYAPDDIRLMSPTFFLSSRLNNEISCQLGNWHHTHRTGYVGASNAGYQVTPGVVLSPDASWVSEERLSREQRQDSFPPICPDFVVELKSKSDQVGDLQAKMRRWLAHGIRLGWLVVPETETMFVYRHAAPEPQEVTGLDHALAADPELPGFALDLTELRREMAR